MKRSAIALMITLFFIMAISLSLGIALKQVKTTSTEVSKQVFAMQSSMIVDDVLSILKTSPELAAIDSSEALYSFLTEASIIPFESNGVNIIIELKSARAMLNINRLTKKELDANGVRKINEPLAQNFNAYLMQYNVNSTYLDMLIDNMREIKPDNSYNSDIFNENPYLFRDYVTSVKHLYDINQFYAKTYNENSLEKIDFEKLFYFSKDKNRVTKVDLNYASADTWRLLLGCDVMRAEQLSMGGGTYETIDSLNLSPDEIVMLNSLNHIDAYFEKNLDVKVSITKGSLSATLRFEYDMNTKKGSNFVYEI